MMPTGLFSQIALIVLSGGIIFTYIMPALDEVKKSQDTIAIYQEERSKVSAVNTRLDEVAARLNSINTDDERKLLTYMPDSVDTVAVPRDIKAIADANGLVLSQVAYVGSEAPASADAFVDPAFADPAMGSTMPAPATDPEAHMFAVSFEASYEQIKQFLSDLEKNAYPLEVHDLVITKTEGGFLAVELKLVTYDRLAPQPAVDPSLVVPAEVTI